MGCKALGTYRTTAPPTSRHHLYRDVWTAMGEIQRTDLFKIALMPMTTRMEACEPDGAMNHSGLGPGGRFRSGLIPARSGCEGMLASTVPPGIFQYC